MQAPLLQERVCERQVPETRRGGSVPQLVTVPGEGVGPKWLPELQLGEVSILQRGHSVRNPSPDKQLKP